jgi:hypothetical protein
MSMIGYFREIPPPLLSRLQADPSLVEEIVGGGSQDGPPPLSPERLEDLSKTVKHVILDAEGEILKMLPDAQRKMIDALPPEKREEFLKKLAAEVARAAGARFRAKERAPKNKSSVSERDLGPLLDIEKAWHGLHYLLSGDAEETVPGAGEAVLGGVETGPTLGYGPARLLGPERVAKVSSALSSLTREALRARFNPKAMSVAQVYPGGWEGDDGNGNEETAQWLLEAFEGVRDFYQAAASRGAGVLLYLG